MTDRTLSARLSFFARRSSTQFKWRFVSTDERSSEDRNRGCHQLGVAGRDGAVGQMFAVLQSDPRRPLPLTGDRDERPDRRVKAVQQHRSPQSRAAKQGGDAIGYALRRAELLLADFDQDAENPIMVWQPQKAFSVGARGEPGLDSDPALREQRHDGRCVGLRQVHRRIVGQFAPGGDGLAGSYLVVLDPGARGNAYQRAGTGAANRGNRRIDGGQALPPVRSAWMEVQFGRSRGDSRRRIAGHGFGRQRKLRMEIAAARAVETGLNDHADVVSNG